MKYSEYDLQPSNYPLYGHGRRRVGPMGKITLPVAFGDLRNPRTEYIVFDVVNHNYPYNAVFGRGTINDFDAAIH